MCSLCQNRTFFFFFTKIHQAHFRFIPTKYVLCIDRAKYSKLSKHFRLAVCVGSYVYNHTKTSVNFRDKPCDCRTKYAFYWFHTEHGAYHHSTGVTSTTQGISSSLLQHSEANSYT